jgi:hypothetical protein
LSLLLCSSKKRTVNSPVSKVKVIPGCPDPKL